MTSLTINGEAVRYRLDPDTPLLWALRDASNLTGTRHGCDDGRCGACTVLADGAALRSCRRSIAEMEGADVVTIEGLSGGRAHPLVQAFLAEQAGGCGRCEPGFVMEAAALLRAHSAPSAAQVEALSARCACGAQAAMVRALLRAAVAGAPMAADRPASAAPTAGSPPAAEGEAAGGSTGDAPGG